MNAKPLLEARNLRKIYKKGILKRQVVFQLKADFKFDEPTVVGIIGPNGAGKTTLLELLSGEIRPSSGNVFCSGRNIHRIKHKQRKYLVAHHYPPSQFLRSNEKYLTKFLPGNLARRLKRFLKDLLLESSGTSDRTIHLYDELDLEDGFRGFLLDFFSKSRRKGHLVLFCMHPTKPVHLEIMRKICERYIFVDDGVLTQMPGFEALLEDERVRAYLGFDSDTIKSLSSATGATGAVRL